MSKEVSSTERLAKGNGTAAVAFLVSPSIAFVPLKDQSAKVKPLVFGDYIFVLYNLYVNCLRIHEKIMQNTTPDDQHHSKTCNTFLSHLRLVRLLICLRGCTH